MTIAAPTDMPTPTVTAPPPVFPLSRALGAAGLVGAPLLLASTLAWAAGADQLRYAVQFSAAPLVSLGLLGLCAVIASRAPRAGGVLAILAVLGFACGGAGFAIDALHETLFASPSLADEGGLAGLFAPSLPGLLGPLSMLGIGIALLRTQVAAPVAGAALVAGAVLFPVSRIGMIWPLAIVVDLLIAVALVPLAWRMWQGRPLRDA